MFEKKINLEVSRAIYGSIDTAAEALDMTIEELGAFALKRIADEFEKTGAVILEAVHVVPATDEEGNDQPVTIHLNEVQHRVMSNTAKVYGASLAQASKYGLFNFEKALRPEERNGKEMLEELEILKNPLADYEQRYESAIEEAAAELKNEED